MTGQGQVLVGEVCYHAMRNAGWKPEFVGGMTLGADPIAFAVAHHATRQGESLNGFTVRKAPKIHGTARRVEGGTLRGARVVVIEDCVTTGGSVLEALDVVTRQGALVLGTLALVDREEGGGVRLIEAGYEFRAIFTAKELLRDRMTSLHPGVSRS